MLFGNNLEHDAAEVLVNVRLADQFDVLLARVKALQGRLVQRAGKIVNNVIQKQLHALVLQGRTAENGVDLDGDRPLADAAADFLDVELFAVQEFFGQRVIALRSLFHHVGASRLNLFLHVFRNRNFLPFHPLRFVIPRVSLAFADVDDAGERVGSADRKLNRNRIRTEAIADRADAEFEISANLVHLVDEAQTRNVVLRRLTPHRLRLRFHAFTAVEHRHRAVQHAKRTFHFHREVHVTRGIDQIDRVIVVGQPGVARAVQKPRTRGRRRRDRDAAFLFFLQVVHDRRAFVHFADLVRLARVKKNAFRNGRLPRINMSGNADVAKFSKVACHSFWSF